MFRILPTTLLAVVLLIASNCLAHEPRKLPPLFDPARHISVAEIKPGMKGFGLSVFMGTAIEKFDIEVISILRDFNPQYDVVLIRLKGDYLEHTGSIAGMSGSPIYIHDDAGHDRMLGAFAYGWPLMKDAIGGVQPIEYMLGINAEKAATQPATDPATQPSASVDHPHWNLSDVAMLPGMTEPPKQYPFASLRSMQPNPALGVADDSVSRMRPLATPLMMSGLSPKLIDEMSPLLHAYGITALQAGGIGAGRSDGPSDGNANKLAPGSVLSVPLLIGDVEMTAVGTCTEVLGNRVWGFGHPFNNEGPVAWPLGGGEINGVIANLMTSFKLGAINEVVGTLNRRRFGRRRRNHRQAAADDPDQSQHPLHRRGSGDRTYEVPSRPASKAHCRSSPRRRSVLPLTGMHDLPEFSDARLRRHHRIRQRPEAASGQQHGQCPDAPSCSSASACR